MTHITDELLETLQECADDLEAEIEARYDKMKDHPAMAPKYQRDMRPVHHARHLLATLPAEGWKIVPVEPTEEMREALWCAIFPDESLPENEAVLIGCAYDAMLAAAPTPEVEK
ncbi:MAG TPA: hypothetical protein VFX37_09885 [Pseudolabrys sp.]|nr:hypothetical protein [Pseudolabrys sp.]